MDDSDNQPFHDHSLDGVQPTAILTSLGLVLMYAPCPGHQTLIAHKPSPVFLGAPLRPPQLLA